MSQEIQKRFHQEVKGYSYVGLVANSVKIRVYSERHCFEGVVIQVLPDVIILETTDNDDKKIKTVVLKANINGFEVLS